MLTREAWADHGGALRPAGMLVVVIVALLTRRDR
jgi:hypothetical protein